VVKLLMLSDVSAIAQMMTAHSTKAPRNVVTGLKDTLIVLILNSIFEHLKKKMGIEQISFLAKTIYRIF